MLNRTLPLAPQLRNNVYTVNHVAQRQYGRGKDERVTVLEMVNIMEGQDLKCARCKADFCDGGVKFTVDHILPYRKGGRNIASNVQYLCSPCNTWKAVRHVDYLRWTQDEISKGEEGDRRPQVLDITKHKLSKAGLGRFDKAPRYDNPSQMNGVCFLKRQNRWTVSTTVAKVAYSMATFERLEDAKMAKTNEVKVVLVGALPHYSTIPQDDIEYSETSRSLKLLAKQAGVSATVIHPRVGALNNLVKSTTNATDITYRDWVFDRTNLTFQEADLIFMLPGAEDCENARSIRRRAQINHIPVFDLPSLAFQEGKDIASKYLLQTQDVKGVHE